ncbi:MAG TPA: trehalase family glycosidase [Sphingomonas sp.]
MIDTRRQFIVQAGVAVGTLFTPAVLRAAQAQDWAVDAALQKRMYDKALAIALKKVRGGPEDPYFRKPFTDAAFSSNIFYWDTCFIATYAKYHLGVLPIENALDNFYRFQDADGFICREYTKQGKPFWSKDHPVATNPPLLAFAELEVYQQSRDRDRLVRVYPQLKRHFDWLVAAFRMDDGLFISDGLGSGMDNIPRYPIGWKDDEQGIPLVQLFPQIYNHDTLDSRWNRQGRSVDMSAQMALFALNMKTIARLIGQSRDVAGYDRLHRSIKVAVNARCWDEATGFYYDLGYGKPIMRKHIGMFWTLIADLVPKQRLARMIAHLTDPASFWRRTPVATFPADQRGFDPKGGYWLGGIWAPTNYMIIRGLERVGRGDVAERLARQFYWSVARVFEQTDTFWENYAPDVLERGNASKPDFCGWTALAPITLWHEYIKPEAVRRA